MKVKLLLICLFFTPNCFGKKVPKYIREHFTNCYSETKTNIRSLIEIDGYYIQREIFRTCSGPPPNQVCRDTTELNLLFYEDGSFLYNFFDRDSAYPGNTAHYLEQVARGVGTELFYEGQFYWGVYRIEGDTIVAQYINNQSGLAPWMACELKFKVLDRRTIVFLPTEVRDLVRRTNSEREATLAKISEIKFLPAEFRPSIIPLPNSWLKKMDWIYCK